MTDQTAARDPNRITASLIHDSTGTETRQVRATVANPNVLPIEVVANIYQTRTDTYTASGNGVTIDTSVTPLKYYAIQVKGTGAAATAWDVKLEASLDGVNFSQVLQHITSTGDGAILWATTPAPSRHFRSRCVSVTLGSATNLIVTILGVE